VQGTTAPADWLQDLFVDNDKEAQPFELEEADAAIDLLGISPGREASIHHVGSTDSSPTEGDASLRAADTQSELIDRGLCAFWLQNRCFALDVELVREVVNVDAVVAVPLSPPALVGLFNLRGTPVALVDLAQVLELGDRPVPAEPTRDRTLLAIVLGSGDLVAAAIIDKMEAVLPPGRENLLRSEGGDAGVTKGFIEARHRPGLVVTVLDPNAVVERLERLKYV
jgi:chemotaxis signal transduction protein